MQKIFIILCLLCISCNARSSQNTSNNKDVSVIETPDIQPDSIHKIIYSKIRDHIQTYVDKKQFSGAVLVAKQGTVLFKGAFGYADAENKISNETDTKFLIGSTTKSFTAITLLKFEEKGIVDLHTPISKYLPGLRKDLADKLTLHILLKMTSGLPNHLARLTAIDDRKITTDEMIGIINKSTLAYEPGTKYSYSNLNYHLIAAILEKVTGLSYMQMLQQEIFTPLQMNNSGSGIFDASVTKRALGHHVADLARTEVNNLSYATGSGCIYATIEDLYKWDQALYDDQFLSQQSKARAFSGGTEEFGYYGYGFRVRDYERADSTLPKGVLVRHGGTMRGYLANVHRYLDDKITVIILGNISMFPIRDLTTELKNIVL